MPTFDRNETKSIEALEKSRAAVLALEGWRMDEIAAINQDFDDLQNFVRNHALSRENTPIPPVEVLADTEGFTGDDSFIEREGDDNAVG